MFQVIMGKPEVESYWNELTHRIKDGTATKDERKIAKKLLKAFKLLGDNPRHPGLNSHEIDFPSVRFQTTAFQAVEL